MVYGPYSAVRQAGDWYFISGQVGIDPQSKLAQPSFSGQMQQVLANLDGLLAAHSLSPNDVVKTTIFLRNMDDFAACNELYVQYFPEPRPARSSVEVSSLPHLADTELMVEIEAIAYKQEGQDT